jgi:hypothetical protein
VDYPPKSRPPTQSRPGPDSSRVPRIQTPLSSPAEASKPPRHRGHRLSRAIARDTTRSAPFFASELPDTVPPVLLFPNPGLSHGRSTQPYAAFSFVESRGDELTIPLVPQANEPVVDAARTAPAKYQPPPRALSVPTIIRPFSETAGDMRSHPASGLTMAGMGQTRRDRAECPTLGTREKPRTRSSRRGRKM